MAPASATNSGAGNGVLSVAFVDMEGSGDITSVTANLSSIGLGASVAMSAAPPNGQTLKYSTAFTVPAGVAPGSYALPVTVSDAEARAVQRAPR